MRTDQELRDARALLLSSLTRMVTKHDDTKTPNIIAAGAAIQMLDFALGEKSHFDVLLAQLRVVEMAVHSEDN